MVRLHQSHNDSVAQTDGELFYGDASLKPEEGRRAMLMTQFPVTNQPLDLTCFFCLEESR